MTLTCPILLIFSLVALASSRTASARAPSIALYGSSACCSVANITVSKRMHKQKIKESKCSPLFFGRGDKIRTCDFYVPNVALYQAEPHLVIELFLAPRALPVVTKPLSSLLCNLPIGKSLPLLFVRFFRHRRRSQTSPS